MKLRFIECHIPKHFYSKVDDIKNWDGIIWVNSIDNDSILTLQILTTLKNSEKIIDKLKDRYGNIDYRIIVFEPTMTYPPIKEEEKKEPERLIREELYNIASDIAKLTKENMLMLILSTIVAIAGIYQNNVTLLIASMIIAPLLGPNIALSLSITVADYKLALKSIRTIFIELFFVILISIIAGYFLPISLKNPQIHSRISLDFWKTVIALSAGIAGSLYSISNISSKVVGGVMIAISLLPPLIVFGLLIGSGYVDQGFSALILFLVNIIAINLSAVVIFYAYGISPYKWWEKEKARRYTIYAIVLWIALLLSIFLIIITTK